MDETDALHDFRVNTAWGSVGLTARFQFARPAVLGAGEARLGGVAHLVSADCSLAGLTDGLGYHGAGGVPLYFAAVGGQGTNALFHLRVVAAR